ncbi:hypothetical protein [Methanosphaera sp. WGK6]|uniref:hypothetical protein n=1 Tax=Methanosphaera sp. WGK6 TaxID=1561964 RepID=UPI00084C780A|nr:hypothetical protein [Methanosphaera sp. WGK6]OED29629.1 hypothetical protein NL43_07160 [Methanosphaera sp. WGK6]
MIDWDVKMIKLVDEYYNSIFNQKIDFIYFVNHFEPIYRSITYDGNILPDLFNDITYYTVNGVNAKYKVLVPVSDDIWEDILAKRVVQKSYREKAWNSSLDDYYDFLLDEIIELIRVYPELDLLLK